MKGSRFYALHLVRSFTRGSRDREGKLTHALSRNPVGLDPFDGK
jgi:hypothetical protein